VQVKWFEVEDILSIGKARLNLKEAGLTLIDGWNMDDDCANGAGKSSLLNALSFGLFNKIPRKITASDILRKGAKKGKVKICVENKGVEWIIERSRPKGFKVFKNGDEVEMTQVELESHLMSYSQFLISMYSSQVESQKLISQNDSQIKDFFLQLMNLDMFTDARKSAETSIKALLEEMGTIEREFISLKAKVEADTAHLVDEDSVQGKISKISLQPTLDQITELQKIKAPDMSKYTDIQHKLYEKERLLDVSANKKSTLQTQESRLEQEFTRLSSHVHSFPNEVECPHCTKSFGMGSSGAYTMQTMIEQHDDKVAEVNANILDVRSQLALIPDDEPQRNQLKKIRLDIDTKREAEFSTYSTANEQISGLKIQYESDKTSLNHLRLALDKNTTIKTSIKDCKSKMDHFKRLHGAKKAEVDVYREVSQMFSPTGAPAYVMDSIVDIFNEKMETYINLIWPRALYQITTSKVNKDKEIKAKFSQNLMINGENMSIGSLSGGEHKCLSLAMDFAVVDVLQNMFGTRLNPIIMDEPFEGLDATNREKVVELLEKLAVDRNIIVIDHASEAKSMFSDIIKVVKKNGISEIA